jgi:acetyl-CoA carboxylase alpha subunit
MDGLQLFGKAISDLQHHVETLKEAHKQADALDTSEIISQLKWRVEQSQIAVKEAQSDLLFLEEYQLAVETSRRKLESEVKDLTPICMINQVFLYQFHLANSLPFSSRG